MNLPLPLSKSLDTIKVYCIFLVVLGHVLRMYSDAASFPQTGTWITSNLCLLLYSFHMPLFISVSGAVYGICVRRGKYKEWGAFFIKKIKRLLFPYFLFGLFVLAPCLKIIGLTNSWGEYLINEILWGKDIKHLWYLLSLFEMFVIIKIIEKILNRSKWYFVLLTSLFCCLMLQYFFNCDVFQFNMTIQYFPFFIFGYFVGSGNINIELSNTKLIVLFIFSMLLCKYQYSLPTCTLPFIKYVIAFGFICIILKISKNFHYGENSFVYNIVKRDGMGIYLWHMIIIYISYAYDLFVSWNLYIRIMIISIVSFLCAILLTQLFRKIKLTFFIGE